MNKGQNHPQVCHLVRECVFLSVVLSSLMAFSAPFAYLNALSIEERPLLCFGGQDAELLNKINSNIKVMEMEINNRKRWRRFPSTAPQSPRYK